MTPAVQTLALNEGALETIVAWQRDAVSLEVCALLAEDQRGHQRILRLTNSSVLRNEFEICQSEENVVRAAAQQRGWKVLAFVHTHPHDEPEMSARDARCFERDTLPWIIVGAPLSAPRQRTFLRALSPARPVTSAISPDFVTTC